MLFFNKKIFTIIFKPAFILLFFLCAQVGAGENFIQKRIVTEFCQMDFVGTRLSSKSYGKISRLVAWEEEPGWDSMTLVSNYQIKDISFGGSNATIDVYYEVVGTISGNKFLPTKKNDKQIYLNEVSNTVAFKLSQNEYGWKIIGPLFQPHVSPETALVHFEKLAESSPDSDELKKLILKIREITDDVTPKN